MIWGHNSKTYIFSGTMYWRLDDDTGQTEMDYPRDMSIWRGVDYNIDAVFQWKDGDFFFFINIFKLFFLQKCNMQILFQELHTFSRGKVSGSSMI
jgi:hypothetical protein